MALKSSSEKVKMKKKIFKEEKKTSVFDSKQFAFFGGTAFIFLVLSGFTFFSMDFQKGGNSHREIAARSNQEIDFTTTSSVGRSSQPPSTGQINVSQRRAKDIQNQERQQRRVEDLTRIIQRLRNEQATLNTRVAELDSALSQNIKQVEKLQRDLNLAKDKIVQAQVNKPVQIPVIQSSHLKNPERTDVISPKSVAVRKIPLSTQTASVKKVVKPKASPKNQIEIAKSKPLSQQEVDQTIVSSISRVDKAEFAIDLGINPSNNRAEDLWKTLNNQHPDDFSTLKPSYIKTGSTKQETRLLAGPFADASDAIRLCVKLKIAKNYCKTTIMPK